MSAKHTPGPWFPVAKNSEWNEVARIGAAWGICTGLPLADMGHPKHDAALIASAPELLVALRLAYEALQISYPLHSVEMEKRGALFAQIRGAITKATGAEA